MLLLSFPPAASAETVSITRFGVGPNANVDVVPALQRAIAYCKGKRDMTLVFPKGRYEFLSQPKTNVGIELHEASHLTIDGQGSEFVFHATMKPVLIYNCQDISMRNFSIDWDRPFINQGTIVKTTGKYVDVAFDKQQYPYVIENGRIVFEGEYWRFPPNDTHNTHNLFDPVSHEIVYNTWDAPLGDIFRQRAEEIKPGTVRFYGRVPMRPANGTIVAIYSINYYEFGFDIQDSKDIVLQNIRVYHAMGHAFYAHHTENITIDNAFACANEAKGRVFSSASDAYHFMNCKGNISITHCEPTGAGDDFIDCHGRQFLVTQVQPSGSVIVRSPDIALAAGEEVWVVDKNTFQRSKPLRITSVIPLPDSGPYKFFQLTFSVPSSGEEGFGVVANSESDEASLDKLPSLQGGVGGRLIKPGDCLESKTWVPNLRIANCKILKRHRARGILATTPGQIVIEDNYFRTAGTALLIEGDMNFWYESGGITNMIVRNNVFDDCLTSGNRDGRRDQWGEAIITISPQFTPQGDSAPAYHDNISITGNTFKTFDTPILAARSVSHLTFTGNTVSRTTTYRPYAWQHHTFMLDGCRSVVISRNQWDNSLPRPTVSTQHMKPADITTDIR